MHLSCHSLRVLALLSLTFLFSCSGPNDTINTAVSSSAAQTAFGAPGREPTWAYSGKTGIGTSYEQYTQGKYSDTGSSGTISRVWFSLAEGIVTETMFGLIHEAQLKDMQFIVHGPDFIDQEKLDTNTEIEYLHTDSQGRPLSLAYKITNTDKNGDYKIVKIIFTDPNRNTLIQRVTFHAYRPDLQVYLVLNPHIDNTGVNDHAWQQGNTWIAAENNHYLALQSNIKNLSGSVGFIGESDLLTDLENNGKQDWHYQNTGEHFGNVSIAVALPVIESGSVQWDFVLGFGNSANAAMLAASGSLTAGLDEVLKHYNGDSDYLGWEDYLNSLSALPALASIAKDKGKLAHVSAMVLKAQEDKTHAGALIASLSNPWGDVTPAIKSSTGYKAVWPRDFYQVAMALLALGDTETPKVAFNYLKNIQVNDKTPGYEGVPGWFLQKTHVDGELEWFSVQLDQTAMPIMLAWSLYQHGAMSLGELKHAYSQMLKPAADFLSNGGKISLDWNQADIHPPYTQQERWEEQEGYSPSTMAAVITGLICAAEIATLEGDIASATLYRKKADEYEAMLEDRTVIHQGILSEDPYYVRISTETTPNTHAMLLPRNGQKALAQATVMDAGFLELVRYGVRAANDKIIQDTLKIIDLQSLTPNLRVKYDFSLGNKTIPGFRRYGGDGYGEKTRDGRGYGINGEMHPDQRGRVWPFFTGERGHYEIAQALANNTLNHKALQTLRTDYAGGMEAFANEGLMLPEQVWDGVGSNKEYGFAMGHGTNSATPLAWTHAEYLKLLRSLHDKAVWDRYTPVTARYNTQNVK